MPLPGTIQQVHTRLSQLADQGFCSTALAAYQGQILLHKGYGWADRERRLPMQPAMDGDDPAGWPQPD